MSGPPTRMKTIGMLTLSAGFWLPYLLLASWSSTSAGSQCAREPAAPRPCAVLQTHPAQPAWRPGGRGSAAVTQGCTLTVWPEQGGPRTFPGGAGVPLQGWQWGSRRLAFHCSCEQDGEWNPVDEDFRKFLRQHVDQPATRGDDGYCNRQMRKVNTERGGLPKEVNTFIHAEKHKVVEVCTTKPIRTPSGEEHCSTRLFSLTKCKKSDRTGDYIATNLEGRILITCRGRKPVHFNGMRDEGSCPNP